MIQARLGLNWPSGFRGEDFWKSLQTDDGCQVMAIAHTGELKKNDTLKTTIDSVTIIIRMYLYDTDAP
jgi:hypothetical protein